jgi:hypothetical protein
MCLMTNQTPREYSHSRHAIDESDGYRDGDPAYHVTRPVHPMQQLAAWRMRHHGVTE